MMVNPLRPWLVGWLYLVGAAHLVGALLVTWLADLPMFASYHQQILEKSGLSVVGAEALGHQIWWMQLFGASLQAFSIFMLLLVYAANRQRSAFLWGAMAVTLLCWAPQDIVISLQKNIWSHFWADLAALLVLIPPLIALALIDRNANR